MTTAKPRYDGGGDWKNRQYDQATWEALGERVRKKLRRFYPDKNAKAEPPFAHPADDWANYLLAESESVLSMELWLRLRLTKAELRAEGLLATVLTKCHYLVWLPYRSPL